MNLAEETEFHPKYAYFTAYFEKFWIKNQMQSVFEKQIC